MPKGISRGLEERTTSRRIVLRSGLVALGGLAAAALVGCGGNGRSDQAAGTNGPAASSSGGGQKRKILNEDLLALNDPSLPYPWIIAEPDTPPKRGGIFKDGWSFDIASLDPTVALSVTTNAVPNAVGERLLDYLEGARINPFRQELKPGLATSYETSPDGLTVTFHLTDKAKWHNKPPLNGRPFTAQDVVKVFERNRSTGVLIGYFSSVATIAAVNPTTVQVKMKAPNPDFLLYTAGREGVIYALEQIDNGDLQKAVDVVGTGPFVLTSMRRSDHVSYVRNPDYWQPGKPYLDGAETRMVPDASARLAGLRTGQFHSPQAAVTTKLDADALKKSNPEINIAWNVLLSSAPMLGTVNLTSPHWKDERVRQAMTLGIDRERQIQILFNGFGIPYIRDQAWTYAFEKRPTSQAELGPYVRYDPAEAKKLLAAAGREKLSIDWHVSTVYGDSAISFAVANFKEIGVTVVPRIDQYINVQSTFYQRGFPDTSSGALVFLTADNHYRDMLRTGGPNNLSGLSDPQIDAWATEQSSEVNPQKRRELLRKIWDLMGTKAYRPMDGAAGGAPGGTWRNEVRNYNGIQGVNSFNCSTEPVRHLKDVWLDKDNPSGTA